MIQYKEEDAGRQWDGEKDRSFDTQVIDTEDISYSRYFRASLIGTQTISDSNRL